jgi:MFS family permease
MQGRSPRGFAFSLSNLSILAFSAWSGDQFATWGWRIPFALSIILFAVGLLLRLGILETPVFRLLARPEHGRTIPLADVGPALQTVAWL